MIGENKMELNVATMKLAVQEYLNRRALPSGQVEVVAVWQPGPPSEPFSIRVKPLEVKS